VGARRGAVVARLDGEREVRRARRLADAGGARLDDIARALSPAARPRAAGAGLERVLLR